MPRQRYVLRDFLGAARTVQTYCATAADGLSIATAIANVSAAALVQASGPYSLAETGQTGSSGMYANVQDRLELVFISGQGGVSSFQIPAPHDSGIFLADQESADVTPNGPVDQLRAAFLAHATDSAGYSFVSFVRGVRRRLTRPVRRDALQLIRSVEPSIATPALAFPAIPSNFRHLAWVCSFICDTAGSPPVLLRFNSDSGLNYQWHTSFGGDHNSDTGIAVGFPNGTGNNPSDPETTVFWVPAYSRSVLNKSVHCIRSEIQTLTGAWGGVQGQWFNNAVISRADLVISAGNFLNGTIASLYGLV